MKFEAEVVHGRRKVQIQSRSGVSGETWASCLDLVLELEPQTRASCRIEAEIVVSSSRAVNT